MEYIIQHKVPNGWSTLAPIKRGRATFPYRFSSEKLAEEFLKKFYGVSFAKGDARVVQTSL